MTRRVGGVVYVRRRTLKVIQHARILLQYHRTQVVIVGQGVAEWAHSWGDYHWSTRGSYFMPVSPFEVVRLNAALKRLIGELLRAHNNVMLLANYLSIPGPG